MMVEIHQAEAEAGGGNNITTPPTPTPPSDDDDPPDDDDVPPDDPIINLTTEISGFVFEDNAKNKENTPNNVFDASADTLLEGIIVTLIDAETGEKATLFQENEENSQVTQENAELRSNPTITDASGHYTFRGANPLKKYYVTFEYNGVLYETVDAFVGDDYKINSKALETSVDRETLNSNFREISVNGVEINEEKIKTFSKEELVGGTSVLYTYNNKENLNIYGLIAEYTNKYLEDNKNTINTNKGKFEFNTVYEDMKNNAASISDDPNLKDKLKFIESTQIKATSTREYPLYDRYVIDNIVGTINATQTTPSRSMIIANSEVNTRKKQMYDEISIKAQAYVDEYTDNSYENLIYDENATGEKNKFYQSTRTGDEEYGNYVVPIEDSEINVNTTTLIPTYTYKKWDDGTNTGKDYLYYLRNEIAYILNTLRGTELKEKLINSTYNELKNILDDETEITTYVYAETLEKLENLYYEKKDTYGWKRGEWTVTTSEVSIVKNIKDSIEGDTEYYYTSVCKQDQFKKDKYTVYWDFNHSDSSEYMFYYWREDGSPITNEDGSKSVDNEITTCNVLPGTYETDIENIVEDAIEDLNDMEVTLETVEGIFSEEESGISNIYQEQLFINLGLREREEFDLTVAKDLYSATISINGRDITYNYNNIELTNNAQDWIARVRASNVNYERSIYSSDYMVEQENGPDADIKVTVKYRIALRNQSANVLGKITELIDYYDKDYTYITDSIYMADGRNQNQVKNLDFNPSSIYTEANQTSQELNVGYIVPKEDGVFDIHNTEDKFIYMEFKVNKSEDLLLDVEGVITPDGNKQIITDIIDDLAKERRAKTNIVEINGYKTYYEQEYTGRYAFDGEKAGKVAGLIDIDSTPGNYKPDENYDDNIKKYKPVEDDEAIAGGLYLYVNENSLRTVKGTVWEDTVIRELLEQNIRQGNGTLDEFEKVIQNVKVELVDITGETVQKYYDVHTGKWEDAVTYTDAEGNYKIENFIPGEYRVKFTYDNESRNMSSDDSSNYTRYYNGQDYKSTIYEDKNSSDNLWYIKEMEEYEQKWLLNENGEVILDEENQKQENPLWHIRKSDAVDVWTQREAVNEYSKTLTNNIAESLIPTDTSKYALEETAMIALTETMDVTIEYDKAEVQAEINQTAEDNSDDSSIFVINNIDFGLVERPRAQLSVQKNVSNVKVILSDGSVLFDASPDENGKFIATNIGSIERKLATAYVESTEEALRNSTHVSTEQGRITMNMDEELMQGANMQVTYSIEAENVGEIDYYTEIEYVYNPDGSINTIETQNKAKEKNKFYYYGNEQKDENEKLVETKVEQIIDYVENNMRFSNKLGNIDINKNWEAETLENIVAWDEERGITGKYINYKKQEFDRSDVETSNEYTIIRKDVLEKLFYKSSDIEEVSLDDKTDDAYNTIAVLNSTDSDRYDGNEYTGNTATAPTTPIDGNNIAKSDFVLVQLISPQNDSDDLTYKNVLEVVKTTNDVGRRMYFSIAGNHMPVERNEDTETASYGDVEETSLRPEGREIDTDDGELITIIPPFGANMQQNSQIAIFAIALVAVFGIGVYLIKRKVLK